MSKLQTPVLDCPDATTSFMMRREAFSNANGIVIGKSQEALDAITVSRIGLVKCASNFPGLRLVSQETRD